MHGCVRSGLLGRTSTRSGLTPPLSLNNLLRQNSYSDEGHHLDVAAKDLSQAMGHSLECHLRAYARFTSNETANAFSAAIARSDQVLSTAR